MPSGSYFFYCLFSSQTCRRIQTTGSKGHNVTEFSPWWSCYDDNGANYVFHLRLYKQPSACHGWKVDDSTTFLTFILGYKGTWPITNKPERHLNMSQLHLGKCDQCYVQRTKGVWPTVTNWPNAIFLVWHSVVVLFL